MNAENPSGFLVITLGGSQVMGGQVLGENAIVSREGRRWCGGCVFCALYFFLAFCRVWAYTPFI